MKTDASDLFVAYDLPESAVRVGEDGYYLRDDGYCFHLLEHLHHYIIGCTHSRQSIDAMVTRYHRYPFKTASHPKKKTRIVIIQYSIHKSFSGWDDAPLWKTRGADPPYPSASASVCFVSDPGSQKSNEDTFDSAIERVDDMPTLRLCTSALQLINEVLALYQNATPSNYFTAKRKGDSWRVRRKRRQGHRTRKFTREITDFLPLLRTLMPMMQNEIIFDAPGEWKAKHRRCVDTIYTFLIDHKISQTARASVDTISQHQRVVEASTQRVASLPTLPHVYVVYLGGILNPQAVFFPHHSRVLPKKGKRTAADVHQACLKGQRKTLRKKGVHADKKVRIDALVRFYGDADVQKKMDAFELQPSDIPKDMRSMSYADYVQKYDEAGCILGMIIDDSSKKHNSANTLPETVQSFAQNIAQTAMHDVFDNEKQVPFIVQRYPAYTPRGIKLDADAPHWLLLSHRTTEKTKS